MQRETASLTSFTASFNTLSIFSFASSATFETASTLSLAFTPPPSAMAWAACAARAAAFSAARFLASATLLLAVTFDSVSGLSLQVACFLTSFAASFAARNASCRILSAVSNDSFRVLSLQSLSSCAGAWKQPRRRRLASSSACSLTRELNRPLSARSSDLVGRRPRASANRRGGFRPKRSLGRDEGNFEDIGRKNVVFGNFVLLYRYRRIQAPLGVALEPSLTCTHPRKRRLRPPSGR